VASDVLDDAGPLAVLPRRQVLDDAGSSIPSAGECRVDVGDANLDQVRRAGAFRDDAIRADIRNRAVVQHGPTLTDYRPTRTRKGLLQACCQVCAWVFASAM
jgi:hypothetical protein